ncbi:putative IgGFc-binding protein-like [Apostichopus japonicus]|uniref:Putative IgGFc-binding protein-like n=1 Tax=Stichopus japonicus TaxID=307972 RepID=A0A2G8LI15_STIJA|nr:putative IgGFc-binding protein-like [Apostichopus japonicus]
MSVNFARLPVQIPIVVSILPAKGSHSCVCPEGFLMNGDNCIRIEDCGCYIESETDGERGEVLKEGGIYVSPNCDKRCSCTDNHLSCDDSYQCDPNADCEERNGLLQCYCPSGYSGDGTQCRPTGGTVPSDCKELYNNGERTSGVYEIKPIICLTLRLKFTVTCLTGEAGR